MLERIATATDEFSVKNEVDSKDLERRKKGFTQTIGQILTPGDDGRVIFGAQNEPLRLSQIEALTAFRNFAGDEENLPVHLVQPGGTGKTREGIVLAHAMSLQKGRTLFVVPPQKSVTDFSEKARKLCPDLDVGLVYQAEKCIGSMTFITYASLLRCILGESAEDEAKTFDQPQDPGTMVAHPAPPRRQRFSCY